VLPWPRQIRLLGRTSVRRCTIDGRAHASQVLIGVVPIVLASGLCVALLTRYGLGPYARSESAASPVYHPSRRLEG